MTKLEETYDVLYKENIKVDNFELKDNAFILNYEGNYYIALNNTLDNTNKYIVLNEELGHYYTNSLYKVYNNNTWIRKMEYRAKKWQINKLVPLDELVKHKGKNIYELADIFEVSADFMQKALIYYEELGLLEGELNGTEV
jgi:hypothetical protein